MQAVLGEENSKIRCCHAIINILFKKKEEKVCGPEQTKSTIVYRNSIGHQKFQRSKRIDTYTLSTLCNNKIKKNVNNTYIPLIPLLIFFR